MECSGRRNGHFSQLRKEKLYVRAIEVEFFPEAGRFGREHCVREGGFSTIISACVGCGLHPTFASAFHFGKARPSKLWDARLSIRSRVVKDEV